MNDKLMIQSDFNEYGDQYWFIWDIENNDFVPSEFQSFDSFELAQSFLNQLQAA